MKNYLINSRYFYGSLALHLLLLLSIYCFSKSHHSIDSIGEKNNKIIPGYIFQLNSVKIAHPIKKIPTKKLFFSKYGFIKKKKFEKNKSIISKKNIAQTIAKSPNKNDEFLKIIHNAIIANEHYPANALLLNQSGTVTLEFKVHPTGQIDQITILKSSGFSNLDQAALEALYSLTIIKQADRYLQKATIFSVDVVFAS